MKIDVPSTHLNDSWCCPTLSGQREKVSFEQSNIQTHVVSSCVVTLAEVKVNVTFNRCTVNSKIPVHIIGEMS